MFLLKVVFVFFGNAVKFVLFHNVPEKKETIWVCHNGPWVPQNPMAMVMFPFKIASGVEAEDRVKLKGPPVRHGEVDLTFRRKVSCEVVENVTKWLVEWWGVGKCE